MASSGSVRDAIKRLDLAGGTIEEQQREVARLLASHVGADACALVTLDPATFITTRCDLWGAPHDPAHDEVFGRLEHASDGDLLLIPDLLRRARPAAALVRESGGDPNRSARFRTALSPLGVRDELRCVLVSRGACWGFAALYRLGGVFEPSDERAASDHGAAVADLLRRAMLRSLLAMPEGDSQPPGLVRPTRGGGLVALTPEGEHWMAAGGPRLAEAVRRLVAISDAGQPLDLLVSVESGRVFQVHATTVDSTPAAIIEAPRPLAVALRIVAVWGLTPRERELTGLVAQGRTTAEIAAELGITPYTVQDHLKAVFDKAGVSSRRALVASLFLDHALPRIEKAIPPSPYGWFVERD